ncbi:LPP20 family lipoprotein [Salinivirga cyanobacteriivorans]
MRKMVSIIPLLSLAIVFVFSSCGTTKKTTDENPAPDWVKQKPIVPGHYVGVGTVMKIGIAPEYSAKARNRALNDLASSISSTVSSTSVLHKIENAWGGTEAFNQQIKVETDEYLEGFEPTDIYETENRYWVYYRIDKETYRRKKAERKRKTIQTALDKQKEAAKYEAEGNVLGALKAYIQSIAILKQYLGESCMAEVNGQQTELGSYLLAKIEKIRSNIQIKAAHKQLVVKRHKIDEQPVEFKVSYDGKMLGGIPVEFHYTGGYLKRDVVYASKSARVACFIASSSPKTQKNVLTAQLHWPQMVQNATTDMSIRRLLAPMSMPETKVNIKTLSPIVALNMEKSNADFISRFREMLQEQSLDFTEKPRAADFVIEVDYSFTTGDQAGGLTSVYCEGSLKLESASGDLLDQKLTSAQRGVGENKKLARKNAQDAFFDNVFRRYLPDLIGQIE